MVQIFVMVVNLVDEVLWLSMMYQADEVVLPVPPGLEIGQSCWSGRDPMGQQLGR
jgi:hypothetical protein